MFDHAPSGVDVIRLRSPRTSGVGERDRWRHNVRGVVSVGSAVQAASLR